MQDPDTPAGARHDPDAPAVVVQPWGGMLRRLRAIAAAQALARRHALALGVVWGPDPDFPATDLGALLAGDLPERAEAELEARARQGAPRLGARAEAPGLRAAWGLRRRVRRQGCVLPRAAGAPFADEAGGWARRLLRGRPPEELACLRALAPAAPLAEAIEAFASEHFGELPPIGVHIRRGVGEEAFCRAMEATGRVTRFLVVSETAEMLARLRERFGARVLAWPGDGTPADDLARLYLLARARRVIDTAGRGIGTLAARLGGIEMQVVGDADLAE